MLRLGGIDPWFGRGAGCLGNMNDLIAGPGNRRQQSGSPSRPAGVVSKDGTRLGFVALQTRIEFTLGSWSIVGTIDCPFMEHAFFETLFGRIPRIFGPYFGALVGQSQITITIESILGRKGPLGCANFSLGRQINGR